MIKVILRFLCPVMLIMCAERQHSKGVKEQFALVKVLKAIFYSQNTSFGIRRFNVWGLDFLSSHSLLSDDMIIIN